MAAWTSDALRDSADARLGYVQSSPRKARCTSTTMSCGLSTHLVYSRIANGASRRYYNYVALVLARVLVRRRILQDFRFHKLVVSAAFGQIAFRSHERGLLVLLAGLVPRWRDAVLLVKPDTILRWHRQGFRLLWRLKSRQSGKPRPRLSPDVIELMGRMAESNATWGAERIRGELLKLGIRVAKRTIQKSMRAVRPPAPPRGQRWHTFVRNYTVWAADFLQTYDIWFRPIFAFFIIDINTKRVISVGVTRSPSETWTAQQLRNVTPFGLGPQFIIRDRDDKYGSELDRVAKGAGIRVIRTAAEAPLMNSVCERFLGSVRREALDHVIILGERHRQRLLEEYAFRYHNCSRPHQGLAQRIPVSKPRRTCREASKVVAIPVLGGLHHDYRAAA
jgi:putative transposase